MNSLDTDRGGQNLVTQVRQPMFFEEAFNKAKKNFALAVRLWAELQTILQPGLAIDDAMIFRLQKAALEEYDERVLSPYFEPLCEPLSKAAQENRLFFWTNGQQVPQKNKISVVVQALSQHANTSLKVP